MSLEIRNFETKVRNVRRRVESGETATATARPKKSNLEMGKDLHKAGVARRRDKLRQQAIAAGKLLLGRRIHL